MLATIHADNAKSARTACEEILTMLGNLERGTATKDYENELAIAWDDVTGKELDANKVKKARMEEVEYIHKPNLYTKVPRNKAKQLKAKVITVRWIDINKGYNIK